MTQSSSFDEKLDELMGHLTTVKTCLEKGADENERLRSALREIASLPDVQSDEACLIAKRALNE